VNLTVARPLTNGRKGFLCPAHRAGREDHEDVDAIQEVTNMNDTMQATGRVIAIFASQHLKAASLFRDHVLRIETDHVGLPLGAFFEDIRSYASACIMSSAASLETLINELFIAHEGNLRARMSDFETEFWGSKGRKGIERKRTLDKYQLALLMLNVPKFTENTSPYRDAWALVALRNALFHHKPSWDPARHREVNLVKELEGRFLVSPFPERADFVTMQCMSHGCARWAVETVLAFVSEFDARTRTQLDAKKMQAFLACGA